MRVEVDCKAEKKGWAQRVSKWFAVNEDELNPPFFGPRVWKRLKEKGLAKNLCGTVRKNIEIKGLAGKVEVGGRWAVYFIECNTIKVNSWQEKGRADAKESHA
jgi:hypothetical protein